MGGVAPGAASSDEGEAGHPWGCGMQTVREEEHRARLHGGQS